MRSISVARPTLAGRVLLSIPQGKTQKETYNERRTRELRDDYGRGTEVDGAGRGRAGGPLSSWRGHGMERDRPRTQRGTSISRANQDISGEPGRHHPARDASGADEHA